jgi:hypothetical protein
MPLHVTGFPDYDASAVGVAERTGIRCASNPGYGTKYKLALNDPTYRLCLRQTARRIH